MSALPLELIKGYKSVKVRIRETSVTKIYFVSLLYFISFATRKGSPLRRERITVSLYHQTDPANFPCARKPSKYPEKTHGFRQSVDLNAVSLPSVCIPNYFKKLPTC